MDYQAEYRSKLRTPAEAVRAVKDGDWVDYTSGIGFPPLLDAALAARRDELHDVKVRGNLCMGPLQIVECDPEQTHFLYHTWHCSAYERRLCDRGLCYFTPMIFRNLAWYYREFLTVNVAMASRRWIATDTSISRRRLACPARSSSRRISSFWRSTSICRGCAAALTRSSTSLTWT